MSLDRALLLLQRQERQRLDELRAEIAGIREELEHADARYAALDQHWDTEIGAGLDMPGGAAAVAAYARALDQERLRLRGMMATLRAREDHRRADLEEVRQRRRILDNVHDHMTAAAARDRAERQQRDTDELAARRRARALRIPAPG